MEVILTVWMAMAIWVRVSLLLLLFFIIVGFFLRKLGPSIFKLVAHLVELFFLMFFSILITLYTPFMGMKVKKGQKNFTFVGKMEDRARKIVLFFQKRRKKQYSLTKDTKGYGWYRWGTILLIFFVAGALLYFPESTVSSQADEFDRWLIEDTFKMERISTETAMTVMKDWMPEKDEEGGNVEASTTSGSVSDEPVIFKLEDGRDGGTIRTEPVGDLAVQNTATTIGPTDIITYLNEEEEMGGILWLKVETSSGVIGWISSNIVVEAE